MLLSFVMPITLSKTFWLCQLSVIIPLNNELGIYLLVFSSSSLFYTFGICNVNASSLVAVVNIFKFESLKYRF